MGRIRNQAGREADLFAQTTIGRSRKSDVLIGETWVSSQHAEVRWNEHGWEIRDLGSRNGTFIDGRPLQPSIWYGISHGDAIALGHLSESWTLFDDAPPTALAESDLGRVLAVDGAITLPSAEAPVVEIFVDDAGQWHSVRGDEEHIAHDGDRVLIDGVTWTLILPEPITATRDHRAKVVTASTIIFHVSQDYADIEMEVRSAVGVDHYKHHTHNWLLFELARARLEDAADPDIDPAEHGWVYRPELADKLRIRRSSFNMTVYRARQLFRTRGFIDADEACQYRQGGGTLRIGFAHVEIRQTGE